MFKSTFLIYWFSTWVWVFHQAKHLTDQSVDFHVDLKEHYLTSNSVDNLTFVVLMVAYISIALFAGNIQMNYT